MPAGVPGYIQPELPTLSAESLRLADESGATLENGRRHTDDPRVVGRVLDDGDIALASVRVEIDLDDDDEMDATIRPDAAGNFAYAAYGLELGNQTFRARVAYNDEFLNQTLYSQWSELELFIEEVENEPATVEDLALVVADDVAASPPTTFDPTVAGQVVDPDGSVGFARVKIYRVLSGDDELLGTTIADGQGRFTYTPEGLPLGPIQLLARVEAWDPTALTEVEVEGDDEPWSVGQFVLGPPSVVLGFTLRAAAPLVTSSLALHSDTGTPPADDETANPLLIGSVTGEGSLAGRRVEFQMGDGAGDFDDATIVIAGTATTDAKGRFRWLPAGLAHGADHDVRVRVSQWNATAGAFEPSSHWESLHFTLNLPEDLAPLFQSGPVLAEPSTTVAEVKFIGRILSERDVAGAVIEFDYDSGDGDEFDEWTTTDEFGDFAFTPTLLPVGAANVRARIRETRAQGLIRHSGWQPVPAFTYTPVGNAKPSIEDFENSPVAGGVRLTGTVLDAELADGFTVEFYTAGGDIVGTAEVDEDSGDFEFDLTGLTNGTHYEIFVRAKEPLSGGSAQYGAPASIDFTYLQSTGQPRISELRLTVDTDSGGAGTSSDGATQVASLTGAIAGTPSLGGQTITFAVADGDNWVELGTAITTANGSFAFTIIAPHVGYQRVRALVNSANERFVNFVYDSDDDSPHTLALVAAFAAADANWQTSQTFDGALAQQASDDLYNERRDHAAVAHDFAASVARAARDDARRDADKEFATARSTAERAYQASLNAANLAFLADLASSSLTPEQKMTYDLDDFVWPDAPEANELVLPPDSAQEKPPVSKPTYDGPLPDYEKNPSYRARVQAAEAAYEAALDAAEDAHENRLTEIDEAFEAAESAAHAAHRERVHDAYVVYNANREDVPPDENEEDRQAHLNAIREAWSNYAAALEPIEQAYQDKVHRANAAANAALTRTEAQEAAEKAAANDEYYQSEQTPDDEVKWKNDIFDIDKNYAPKYESILNKRDRAIAGAERTHTEQRATALRTALVAVFDAQAALATLARERSNDLFGDRLEDDLALAEALAAAAKQLQIDLAEAARVRDSARADAGYARDEREAIAERTKRRAIAEAKLTATRLWADAYGTRWSAYQRQLAVNEDAYQRGLAELAYGRDIAYAEAKRTEGKEIAAAEKTRAVTVANAEETRRKAVAAHTKAFRVNVEQKDLDRDLELIDHWRDRRVAFAEAAKTNSFDKAKADHGHAIRHDKARNAHDTATHDHDSQNQSGAYWSEGWDYDAEVDNENNEIIWSLDNQDERERIDYDFKFETASAARDLAIEFAGALKTFQHSSIDAVEAYRTESNSSHHVYATGAAELYATYQIAVAGAQHAYNISVVTAAAVFAVEEAKAQAKRFLATAVADGAFDNAEAPLAGTSSVDDATAKADYEFREADAYFSAVAEWTSQLPTPWRVYQRSLAYAERVRLSNEPDAPGAGSADMTRASALAAENTAWTADVVAADLAYAETMYVETGPYVSRASTIAQAHVDAAEASPLLTYVTDRANAVKTHDVAVADAHKTLFNRLAEVDAERDKKLADAKHDEDVTEARRVFLDSEVIGRHADASALAEEIDDRTRIAKAVANAGRMVSAAEARQAWTSSIGDAHVALVEDLIAAEADWAGILQAEIVTLATGVAHGQRDFVTAEAAALTVQTAAARLADAEHQVAAANIEATHSVAIDVVLSAKSANEAAALGDYEVTSHAKHAAAMTATHGAGSHSATVAAANRDWHTAGRTLRNAYHLALAAIEAGQTAAANAADIAHATRKAAAAQTSGSDQASVDELLALDIAEFDAQLYISRESARASLIVGDANARGEVDLAHAKAVRKRDNAIAKAHVEWVKVFAKVQIARARLNDQGALAGELVAAANERDAAVAAAHTAFAQELKDGAAGLAEDRGALQIAYVSAMAGAVVVHATAAAGASNEHAESTAQLDVALTQALVQSELVQTRQHLDAADERTRAAAQREVDFEAGLVEPAASRGAAIAASEAEYHLAGALAEYAAAADEAAAAPSIGEIQFAAAQADARATWIDLLGPTFVAYRTELARGDAELSVELAEARRARELERSAATSRHDRLVTGYEGTRAQESTAIEGQASVDATAAAGVLSVAIAQADYEHAVAWIKAFEAYKTTEAAAVRDLTGPPLDNALDDAEDKRDAAFKVAKRRWQSDVAAAEYADATADAALEAGRTQDLAAAERSLASSRAHAAHARDVALADAEGAYWLAEASADNVERQASADARADFLGEHYAQRATALYQLVSGLDDLPWAQYEQARAASERDAWLAGGAGSLRAQYIAWQLAVGEAHGDYANERASEHAAASRTTAASVRNHALQLAGATEQHVRTAAGEQQEFAGQLAELVLTHRQARFGYEYWEGEAIAADEAYEHGYAEADLARRRDLARTSAAFVAGASAGYVAHTGAIVTAQAAFDDDVRAAWYDGPSGTSLEARLAALNYQYDLAEAAAFTGAAESLAGASASADYPPWTAFAAARTTARQTDVAQPLAELARFQRAGDPADPNPDDNLAAVESAYRAALAAAGRQRTLAEAQAEAARQSGHAAHQLAEALASTADQFDPDSTPAVVAPVDPTEGPVTALGSFYGGVIPWQAWAGDDDSFYAGYWDPGFVGYYWGLWGYGESDWGASHDPHEFSQPNGSLGWAGPWGAWSYYDALAPYGVPLYAWNGWNTGYAGHAPQSASANQKFNPSAEVAKLRNAVDVADDHGELVETQITESEDKTPTGIEPTNGQVSIASSATNTAVVILASGLFSYFFGEDEEIQQWNADGIGEALDLFAEYEYAFFKGSASRPHVRLVVGDDADVWVEDFEESGVIRHENDVLDLVAQTHRVVVFSLPPDWNDYEAAAFIVEVLQGQADLPGWDRLHRHKESVSRAFEDFILSANIGKGPDAVFADLKEYVERRGIRVLQGLNEIAEAVKALTETAVGFVPGGDASLIVHDLQEGRPGAALMTALTLGLGPLGAIVRRGARGVMLRFGDDVVEFFAASVLARIQRLPNSDKRLLQELISKAADGDQVRVVRDFVKKRGLDAVVTNRRLASSLLNELMQGVPKQYHLPPGVRLAATKPAAHHIFPVQLFNTPLGTKLHNWGIDLNGIDNGVWLPTKEFDGRISALHRGNHKAAIKAADGTIMPSYVRYVQERISKAKDKMQALKIFSEIRLELLNGTRKLYNEVVP